MAIYIGNTSSGGSNSTASLTISHTVASNVGRILFVHLAHRDVATAPSSITYNGDGLTLIRRVNDDNCAISEVWQLVAPDVGTANVVVTMGAATKIACNVWDIYGANQDSNPIFSDAGDPPSANGTSTSQTIVSPGPSLVFFCLGKRGINSSDNVISQGSQTRLMEKSQTDVQGVVDYLSNSSPTTYGAFNWTNTRYFGMVSMTVLGFEIGSFKLAVTADTRLRSTTPTTNYGTETPLYVGEANNSTNNISRWLGKWDLSSLSGKTIESAIIQIYTISSLASNVSTFYVHRLYKNWAEYEATWEIYSTGNSWTSQGAGSSSDIDSSCIGSNTLDNPLGFKYFSLTASAVQAMVDGTINNYGFLIKSATELNDGWALGSKETATSVQRPVLMISYSEGGGLSGVSHINGIAYSAIYGISGVLNASISSIQGIT